MFATGTCPRLQCDTGTTGGRPTTVPAVRAGRCTCSRGMGTATLDLDTLGSWRAIAIRMMCVAHWIATGLASKRAAASKDRCTTMTPVAQRLRKSSVTSGRSEPFGIRRTVGSRPMMLVTESRAARVHPSTRCRPKRNRRPTDAAPAIGAFSSRRFAALRFSVLGRSHVARCHAWVHQRCSSQVERALRRGSKFSDSREGAHRRCGGGGTGSTSGGHASGSVVSLI